MVPVTTLAGADLSGLLAVLASVAPDDPLLAELAPWSTSVTAHRAVSFNGDALLTITASGVDKGTGLLALCAALGIDPSQAAVFGDSDVDLPMFEAAGLAVAMGNASDHVKARAQLVTGPADEAGVAEAVRHIWGFAN